jgi:hypothetical protein
MSSASQIAFVGHNFAPSDAVNIEFVPAYRRDEPTPRRPSALLGRASVETVKVDASGIRLAAVTFQRRPLGRADNESNSRRARGSALACQRLLATKARTPAEPRPDLAGRRLASPGHPDIYVIDPEGFRRRISNHTTYNRLFRSWCDIGEEPRLDRIALGPEFTMGTFLVRGDASCAIYLLDQGRKRRVPHGVVMDKYWFNWSRILGLTQVDIDQLPVGADWDGNPKSGGISLSREASWERRTPH